MPDINEQKRLEVLNDINILHSSNEERFERITRVSLNLFKVEFAGIAFIDSKTVWFKSFIGSKFTEVDRKGSFADLVIDKKDTVVFQDLGQEPDYAQNPLVKDLNIKFYAGSPIVIDGYCIGSFFIAGKSVKRLAPPELQLLKDLSLWATDEVLHGKVFMEEQKMRNDLVSRNQELAREKARSDAMLADIGDGVIGINDKGNIIFINAQVEVMTGYSKAELMGKLLIQAVNMVDAEGNTIQASNQPIRQALFYRKKVMARQYSYVRKDGLKFPVAITATPVVVHDQIIGGVVVFRDITREMEVDRMKTEFISLASHQLRTPLSAMKWFCEILTDGDAGQLNAEQTEILGNIYKSNERMIDLVNTLLNISRIESGRIIIDPKPTDLKKLVDEVVLEVTPKLKQKKQTLAVSVHGKLPLVSVDPKLIRHVYMNLLTNAIKYSKESSDIVVIISKSNDSVISQVSDSGYGIPKVQQEKVFKKFFRAENIIKVETEGTGLGLYLAKAIVESSGGKIWFKSVEGQGTTFWFSVPFVPIKKTGEVSIDS